MINEDESYTDRERAWRWIFYTALPSVFTYVLACIYDYILGYTLLQSLSNHFLEFILMVFAISFSIYGSAANIERKIKKKTKEIYTGLSVVCCFACLVFYGFLYYMSTIDSDESKTPIIDSNVALFIRVVFVILATIVIYAGFCFEAKAKESSSDVAPDTDKIEEGAK